MNFKTIKFALERWIKREGKIHFILGILTIIIRVTGALLSVILASQLVNILEHEKDIHSAMIKTLLFVITFALTVIFERFLDANFTVSVFLMRIVESSYLFLKLKKLPYQEIESPKGKQSFEKSREAVAAGNDVGIEALIASIFAIASNIGCLIGFLMISAKLSWWLVIVLIVSGSFRIFKDKKNREWYKKQLDDVETIHYQRAYLDTKCLDMKIGKDARIYHMIDWFKEKYHMIYISLQDFRKRRSRNEFLAECIHFFIAIIRDVICYGYLIYMVTKGLSISEFILYFSVISGINIWIKRVFDAYANYKLNLIIVEHFRNYLKQKEYTEEVGQPYTGDQYKYEFKNVSFAYEKGNDVIKHLDLTIEHGEKIALVGANGAGKSTLVKLMSGLYQPTEGQILLNGIDIKTIGTKELLKTTSVVFQEVKVFPVSIAGNVSCQLLEKTNMEKVDDCLKSAGIYEYVQTLPKKEMTSLTKLLDLEGIEMSGGQYQKLMLARAIYKESPVLILDEPTAALDPLAEEAMYKEYHQLTKGKTSVFISHRLSSTQFCDRIIFLEDGKIKQDGSHEELMHIDGPYKRMFDVQSHYYQEEVEEVC